MTVNNLQPDYYVNYFQQMIVLVQDRYQDILSLEDQRFIESFYSCSQSAKRLLIRLYLRKGPLFLSTQLEYPEVEDTRVAIDELCKKYLLEKNPVVYAHELIALLPAEQCRMLFSPDEKLRKADLLKHWLDDNRQKNCREWGASDEIIRPCQYDTYHRLQLLCFGNSHLTFTEFILEDIGLFSYEKFSLDKTFRLFDTIEEVELYITLNELNAQFHLMREAKKWDELESLAQQALGLEVPTKLQAKWHRLLNRLAYRLEQEGELQLALDLFSTNNQPISRERQIRILYKQEKYRDSLKILESFGPSCSSKKEALFYYRFVNKLHKKLGLNTIKQPINSLNEVFCIWDKKEGCVEQQACKQFPGSVWLENSLPNSIFGLLHWQIIFMDLPGVWHHPFQSAPTDLYEPDFTLLRENKIKELHSRNKDEWRQAIAANWKSKFNIRNPFVHWDKVTLDILILCFDSFSKEQWLGVFKHFLMDIKQHKSGFPDLFQYHNGAARFIEIKGPGDKLQDNQISWLEVFKSLSIPSDVCYVRYRDT